eukprot:TRINITY_DN2845_c0_g1_i1.p2 TRINITY_DN2845_c0_g1~~TRINITY_DN2845_c0_g1_i1.p2  ORF type:complete len:129 (+),score=38.32 TRINITY_DN2845_c0_g1_i1:240-626(+)
MMAGDMTLVDELGSIQLAIQATVRQAFQTPEVIAMFAKKQPGQLRERLQLLQRDLKLGRLSEETYKQQSVEIIAALKKLGEKLSAEEASYLAANMSADMQAFESTDNAIGGGKLLSSAAKQVEKAGKQ